MKRTKQQIEAELKAKIDEARAKGQLGPMEQAFVNAKTKKPKTKSKLPLVQLPKSTIDDYAALQQPTRPTQEEIAHAELKRAQEELNKSLSSGIGTQMDYAVWKLKNKDWL